MENNALTDLGKKRQSILLNNEYDSSESNIVMGNNSESNQSDLVSRNNEEREEEEDNDFPTANLELPSAGSTEKTAAVHIKNSKVRFKKDGQMRSNFGDMNFLPRETILDREVKFGAKFYGFFVAFWICVVFYGLNVVCGYSLNHGSLWNSAIVHLMLKDLWKVAITDLIMYLSMYLSVLIQILIKYKFIKWKYTGVVLQSIYEILLLCYPSHFSNEMNFPWIAQIFIMLHSVVMLMKVHSFAFFNGYLWEITNELKFSTMFFEKKSKLPDNINQALENSIEFCNSEIKSQDFPNNISCSNFFEYSMFPVLVYQTKYPRTEKIRWDYLLTKVSGIFGIILLIIAISQFKLYPIVLHCLEIQKTTTLWYRIKEYPFILIDTIPPFLSVYLLIFYLIWELILNSIAELSRFGDREFYAYWWNSIDWTEYARDWNVPVHKFLLRHVYHSSISAFKVNKTMATFFTFLLSSFIHELAMYVIFRKIRFYLLMLQMSQLSLVQLSRTKWMKDKKVLGNCIFWFGIVFGPSLMCTMYLVF
ncbi:acyl-CoA/sterol acyltransferase [Pichia californica]|uniref:O-acyltransferase n=1 Tax=Pichia californica TaxID=460514 RepID=A0A9P7BHB9_9ASCO|nr:acyl-CoA/sterol acyltransferase [[Candida] californica]KAG0689253.1 acyl-CoA/sterol acyltransferase [[Candida] californica]